MKLDPVVPSLMNISALERICLMQALSSLLIIRQMGKVLTNMLRN